MDGWMDFVAQAALPKLGEDDDEGFVPALEALVETLAHSDHPRACETFATHV